MTSSDAKPEEPARMDGPNAHVVDQLLGNDHRKRSRPTGSSLDYHKPEDADSLVTPGDLPEQQDQEHYQQQQQQTDEGSRPKIATRARGSSGIPPRGKLQLEDLQGMSQDEIMQALYEDPELAAAAASQVDNDKPSTASSSSSSSSASGNAKKIPQGKRVDSLKERGFPFVQWAVLLLLLGLAIYQIYKSMLAPSTKSRSKKPAKTKSNKTVKSSSSSTKNKTKPAQETKESVRQEPATKKETKPATQVKATKENGTEKPVSAPKKKKVKAKKTKPSSSSDEEVAPAVSDARAVAEQAVQDDGWTTVGKESDSKPKVETKNGAAKPAVKSADTQPIHEDVQTAEPDEFQPVSSKSKKKKKKKKTQENGDSSKQDDNRDDVGTDGDAALAMELQQFEQRSLQSEVNQKTDDAWEEVKPKKRKS